MISDEDRAFRSKQGYGVLAGDAMEDFDNVDVQMLDHGMGFVIRCQDFGHPNGIVVDWVSLILLSQRRIPAGWQVNSAGRAYPMTACKRCQVLTSVQLTPDEAARYVKQAVSANKITAQQVNQVLQSQVLQSNQGKR